MTKQTPTLPSFLPAAIILSVGGWGGVWYLATRTLPTLGPRWFFFAAVVVAVAGTTLPFIAFLNKRFPINDVVNYSTIVRESIWTGVYVAALLWLNKGQVLSAGLALILGLGFLFAEALLRMGANNQWRPGKES